jgi:hypothetical protein
MKIICRDRQKTSAPQGRALSSVAADINRLLSPKTYEQLQTLEVQVKRKLNSNEPIDTDYWEELLRSLTVWKARARLRNVYQDVIDERVRDLRKQQKAEAESMREKLAPLAPTVSGVDQSQTVDSDEFKGLDPDPLLHVRQEDKGLEIMDETVFLRQVVSPPPGHSSVNPVINPGYRLENAKRSFVWGMSHSDNEVPKGRPLSLLALSPPPQLRQGCPVASLRYPTTISRKLPRPCTRGSWPRV